MLRFISIVLPYGDVPRFMCHVVNCSLKIEWVIDGLVFWEGFFDGEKESFENLSDGEDGFW